MNALLDVPFAQENASLLLNNIFEEFDGSAGKLKLPPPNSMKVKDIFATVHNATVGHWGAAESWRRMNKFAPCHGLSQKEVAELVFQCVNCVKNRREKEDKLILIHLTRALL